MAGQEGLRNTALVTDIWGEGGAMDGKRGMLGVVVVLDTQHTSSRTSPPSGCGKRPRRDGWSIYAGGKLRPVCSERVLLKMQEYRKKTVNTEDSQLCGGGKRGAGEY